jgi:hypothetical protein
VGKEEHVSIGVVWGQMPIPKGLVNKRCAVVKRMYAVAESLYVLKNSYAYRESISTVVSER